MLYGLLAVCNVVVFYNEKYYAVYMHKVWFCMNVPAVLTEEYLIYLEKSNVKSTKLFIVTYFKFYNFDTISHFSNMAANFKMYVYIKLFRSYRGFKY